MAARDSVEADGCVGGGLSRETNWWGVEHPGQRPHPRSWRVPRGAAARHTRLWTSSPAPRRPGKWGTPGGSGPVAGGV